MDVEALAGFIPTSPGFCRCRELEQSSGRVRALVFLHPASRSLLSTPLFLWKGYFCLASANGLHQPGASSQPDTPQPEPRVGLVFCAPLNGTSVKTETSGQSSPHCSARLQPLSSSGGALSAVPVLIFSTAPLPSAVISAVISAPSDPHSGRGDQESSGMHPELNPASTRCFCWLRVTELLLLW